MKKITAIVLVITFLIASAGLALAQDKREEKVSAAEIKVNAEIKETPIETQEVKPNVAAREEMRKKRQEELKVAKEELGKQEWVIYLTSLTDRKSMGSDTLKFSDGMITAVALLEKGYSESNCTITPQEDGTFVWETMQVHENGDRIFWRGELSASLMQGVMSMHSKDGKTQDISFTTTVPKVTEEKIEHGKDKRDKGKK